MKKLKLAALAAVVCLMSCGGGKGTVTASYEVIPQPQEVIPMADEPFVLNGKTVIAYPADDDVLKKDAELLRGYIKQLTGYDLKVTDKVPGENAIVLRAELENENPEGYVLTVDQSKIDINGATAAGTFYGIQTLRKSIPEAGNNTVNFPGVIITDEPRFSYRGAHLDVARHFFPVDSVKTFIDMLALHNMNRFHWHLTDDQGWRVEIKSRPLLTELGSKRSGTVIGHNSGVYDSIPVEGFYTQDEVRDIIQYAADRHITIVPEIDLPGHMLGALKGYPELGCTGGPYDLWQHWGVSEDVLCAGNDSTYVFIDDVLGEIADLFPGEYVHVGGDECPKVRWEECVKCQAKIVELGLKADEHGTKEEKLQSHVIHHASDFLASKGKKMIGWDETLEGGLAPGAVVMSWRGEAGGIAAAKLGHDVIMTPNNYLYFDYYQTLDRENEPDAIGGYVPVEKVYSYEPMPADLTDDEKEHIFGVQANIWTEYIPTFSQVEYMALPRYAALSEVQWSKAPKDYKAFVKRVPQLVNQYKANGYNYATHVFDVQGNLATDPEGHTIVATMTTADDAPVYYTLDGTEPTEESALYEGPISLDKTTKIKAVAIRKDGKSRIYNDSISFNKATTRPIEFETKPHPRYTAQGPATLVDGKFGANGFNTGGWVGFAGNDLVAVINMEEPQEISEVSTRTCVDTGSWVFDATGMKVSVSNDGKSWRQVASATYPALEKDMSGIIPHSLTFEPTKAQYVKVTLEAQKKIPAWHNGAGKPGFVFVDEIEVN